MALNQLKMRNKTDHLVPFEVPCDPFSSLIISVLGATSVCRPDHL